MPSLGRVLLLSTAAVWFFSVAADGLNQQCACTQGQPGMRAGIKEFEVTVVQQYPSSTVIEQHMLD
jgi:hypothetical protein